MEWKRGIILILGLYCVTAPWFFDGAEGLEIIQDTTQTGAKKGKSKPSNSEIGYYFTDENARTFGQMMPTLFNLTPIIDQISNVISNVTSLAGMFGNDIQNLVNNQSGNNSLVLSPCEAAQVTWDALKIPIFVIAPAVIIGVVILIKVIGLITAWIPSVSAHFFKKFKGSEESDDSDSEGYGYGSSMNTDYGSGYPSPSSAYGVPTASSSAYGAPGGGGFSRQTAILNAIDNVSNLYGYNDNNQAQQQVPNFGDEGNYGENYQGGQSLQNSQQNSHPYYYYQNQNQADYSNSEKTSVDNSQLPIGTTGQNPVG